MRKWEEAGKIPAGPVSSRIPPLPFLSSSQALTSSTFLGCTARSSKVRGQCLGWGVEVKEVGVVGEAELLQGYLE